jgi:branched-chain amino acid transport system ATP-binding protein
MGKLLEVHNLMVFFENALAINDLSLEVNQGDLRGVIGSNSAGKTTLMHALSGLLVDMRTKELRRGGERITILGKIIYEGRDITHLPPHLRVQMGIVLCRERHPIFPESSVMENLKIAAHLRPRSEMKETAQFVFRLFPILRDLMKRRAGFLSGGEQQMLSIGMALMARPRLLLLDEPLLRLSPAMQRHLVDAIKEIRSRQSVTILIAEQFARPILGMLDFGYVIENGMMTLCGAGDELMGNPEVRAAYFGV